MKDLLTMPSPSDIDYSENKFTNKVLKPATPSTNLKMNVLSNIGNQIMSYNFKLAYISTLGMFVILLCSGFKIRDFWLPDLVLMALIIGVTGSGTVAFFKKITSIVKNSVDSSYDNI